jgi:ribonuclease HI
MVLPKMPPHREAAVTLYADGGTLGGSPGSGIYWSVGNERDGVLRYEDKSGKRRRSDEAEYLALLTALRVIIRSSLEEGDVALVYCDCRPVVNHIRTQQKPRTVRLRSVYWDIQEALERLKDRGIRVVLVWTKRDKMVEILGH